MPNKTSGANIPNIVTIGGGTGSFIVLSALKTLPANIIGIVGMMDSGGSTGRLRDQLGVLPPGDVRQALVALSESPEMWRKLFLYRFEGGDLDGHNFGNIFISALEKLSGSIKNATSMAASMLRTRGKVVPVTNLSADLCARLVDGTEVRGEHLIDGCEGDRAPIEWLFSDPEVSASPDALVALAEADYVILGPGDLYTSILPNFVVEGIPSAFCDSKAKFIYISNIMTKKGQTDGFGLVDFVAELDKYTGRRPDYIIYNNSKPSPELLEWYLKSSDAEYVVNDLGNFSGTVVEVDVMSDVVFEQAVSDRVKRSLIRHDPQKLANVIDNLISK